MAADKTLYNEKSIESLSPLEFTRLRPNVYCGDTTYSTQLLVEIISNAIDEFRLGHGNVIKVSISDNNVIAVEDNGQGFIYSMRDDGKSILEAAFSVLNTSGKYREDGTYEGTSLGSYGIGSKLCNFLSHNLTVISYRDGKAEMVVFEEGVYRNRYIEKVSMDKHGTIVQWEPSEEFFTHPEVEINKVKELFKTIVCLCPGLKIILNGEEYFSKNGLIDLIDEKIKDKEILNNRCLVNSKSGKYSLDLVMTYTGNYNATIIPYVNTGLTESGPHITQLKTILTREFNRFLREKQWLKEKDENLTGDDIQEGLYLVFNITAPNVAYDAQVKSRVTKIDTTFISDAFRSGLNNWFIRNEKDVKIIADKAINARKAREAAKKARDSIRQPKEKGLKAKMKLSSKFIDCVNKNPSERNLMLVEGLSAGSAAVEARNAKTDSIYMLRGKVVSPLKTEVSKILANQEMSDIIQIIGGGFGDSFDVSKINFDKVVITVDQDSDGSSIALLLMTFFFTYMKPLVLAGKLYRAITPLYIVRDKKEELYFYSDDEMNEWRKTHNSNKYDVLRAKGLGELNATDLHRVCFQNQRFKRITVSDIQETAKLLEILEGKQIQPRKDFIYENAEHLGFNFD